MKPLILMNYENYFTQKLLNKKSAKIHVPITLI